MDTAVFLWSHSCVFFQKARAGLAESFAKAQQSDLLHGCKGTNMKKSRELRVQQYSEPQLQELLSLCIPVKSLPAVFVVVVVVIFVVLL